MRTQRFGIFLLLVVLAEIFSYPTLAKAQESSFRMNAADQCLLNESDQHDAEIIRDDYGKNWIAMAKAEAHMTELSKKCLALAPSLPTYYKYTTIHQSKSHIMLDIVSGYEMASYSAICAHRPDLFALYDKEATKYIELIKQQPPGSISDPPDYMGFHTSGDIEAFKSALAGLHYHSNKCPM